VICIWLDQLLNTANLWWIDVYYLVINYMFQRLWPSSGWWINKNTHKQLPLACVLYTEDGGRSYWMGVRDLVCIGQGGGVYMGLYYANLSIVQFRAMMLGVHVYVYILVPPSNNPAHHPPYIRRMPNLTAYTCFLFFVNSSTWRGP
jgi:hypothetical protein